MTALEHDYADTHNGSRKVQDVARLNATEAAHRRFGEAVIELERLDALTIRAFKRLDEAREQMEAAKVRAEPMLSDMLAASYGVWQHFGDRDERLELATATPPPLP